MIAAELKVTLETVRTYIKRMYEKLRVHSVTEAINKAFPIGKFSLLQKSNSIGYLLPCIAILIVYKS